MDEELREWLKKVGKKAGFVVLALIFVFVGIPGIYFGVSGNLSVPAQTVKIVKEPAAFLTFDKTVSRAYVNDGKESKGFRKSPVIPGKNVGFVEKEYSLDQLFKFEKKGFASWLKSDRTGKKSDLETVEGFVLYGEFTVRDWQAYVDMIDPSQYAAEGKKEIIEREYIVGAIIQDALQYAAQNYYPQLETEFLVRMEFVKAISKSQGLTDPEKIKTFILENAPWYWAVGVLNFQQMAQTGRIYGEQVISPWFGDVKVDWQAKFQTGQITEQDLHYCCWKAYEFEKKMLSDPKTITKEETDFYQNVLMPFFTALAKQDMTNGLYDNDLLWSMAIEEAFKSVEEATFAFTKEIVPAFLENATKAVLTQDTGLASLVKVINLKITIKFEERPLLNQKGTVDPDFQEIYKAHQSEFESK